MKDPLGVSPSKGNFSLPRVVLFKILSTFTPICPTCDGQITFFL